MSDENVELIRQLYRRWGQGDFATPGFFDPNVETLRVGGDASATAGAWRGLDAAWKASVEWLQAWENVRLESRRCIDLGSRVLVIARQTGQGRRSGVEIDQELAMLFTLRDAKIVRWEIYLEVSDALEAVGLKR